MGDCLDSRSATRTQPPKDPERVRVPRCACLPRRWGPESMRSGTARRRVVCVTKFRDTLELRARAGTQKPRIASGLLFLLEVSCIPSGRADPTRLAVASRISSSPPLDAPPPFPPSRLPALTLLLAVLSPADAESPLAAYPA